MKRLYQLAGYYPSLVARQFLGSFCQSIYIYIPFPLHWYILSMTSGFRPNPPRSSQVKHPHSSSTQTTHVSRGDGVTVWLLDVPWLSMTAEWPLNTEPNIGTGSSGSNSRANGLQSLNSHFSIPSKDMRYHEMSTEQTHWMVTHGNLWAFPRQIHWFIITEITNFGMSSAASKTARRTEQANVLSAAAGSYSGTYPVSGESTNVSWRLRLNISRCIWNPHPIKTWTTQPTCPLQDEFLHILAHDV